MRRTIRSSGAIKDIFAVSLGGFLVDYDTTVRLESYWRFAPKHRLDFGSLRLRRSHSRIIDRQIGWGDLVFPVNAQVDSEFGSDLVKLGHRYSFVRNEHVEAGLSFGFSTFLMSGQISGQVVSGMTTVFDSKQEDVVAPIPVVGLHGEFRLVRTLYARAGVEYFQVSVSDKEGSLTDVRASLD